ncbi:hypothetical protein NX059_001607 [Plenodomus lindquistii]|nr:hypothetical protein NX059_001607 [Plenodomus lindquistii]
MDDEMGFRTCPKTGHGGFCMGLTQGANCRVPSQVNLVLASISIARRMVATTSMSHSAYLTLATVKYHKDAIRWHVMRVRWPRFERNFEYDVGPRDDVCRPIAGAMSGVRARSPSSHDS